MAGEQFGYTFDHIGNRTSTDAGSSELGTGLRHATYSANTLNHFTNRTVPAAVSADRHPNHRRKITHFVERPVNAFYRSLAQQPRAAGKTSEMNHKRSKLRFAPFSSVKRTVQGVITNY